MNMNLRNAALKCPRCGSDINVHWPSPFDPRETEHVRILAVTHDDANCIIGVDYEMLRLIDTFAVDNQQVPHELLSRLVVPMPRSWREAEEKARVLEKRKQGVS